MGCCPRSGGWLEHDHSGLVGPPSCVRVEVLVDLGPARPQPLAFGSDGAMRAHLPYAVAGAYGRVGVGLQVQPPGGLGSAPAVHRHRDDVVAVLEVADENLA